MHRVIRSGELRHTPTGSVRFEGETFGSGISFFLINYHEPGAGPELHRHPYSETWIIRSGKALFTADGETIEARPGDILIVGPETPHKFKSVGPEGLDIICIHASSRMVQEELEK